MIELTSAQNPRIKSWKMLNTDRAARLSQGLFPAEGEHMAQEALKEGAAHALLVRKGNEERYSGLIFEAEKQQLPVYLLSTGAFSALCDAKTPQGIMALCRMEQIRQHFFRGVVVALDDVQDPGNVGTILRTMDGAGFDRVILSRGCADPFSPKALRASMGAVFRIPVQVTEDLPGQLESLKNQGYSVYAGSLSGQKFYDRPPDPEKICLIIGNEGNGISGEVLSRATHLLKLPMEGGAESLNAAVACAVMLYDILKNRL